MIVNRFFVTVLVHRIAKEVLPFRIPSLVSTWCFSKPNDVNWDNIPPLWQWPAIYRFVAPEESALARFYRFSAVAVQIIR